METGKEKTAHGRQVERVLWIVLVLNLVVAASKYFYGLASGSASMQADGIHSVFDSLGNVIGLVGISLAARPADAGHPYGHSKFETYGSLAIGVLLLFAAFEVGSSAVEKLVAGTYTAQVTPVSFIVMVGTLVVNLFVTLYERRAGKRLKSESLAVTVGGMNIAQLSDMTVRHAREKLSALTLNKTEEMIAGRILKEIDSRLGFLISVGLDYLTLSRAAGTLSGGEAQRIRLATQIGSSLVGVLYILDEPSIGLHQRDNAKLIDTLKGMRDIGNTLIVVEHDEETMLSADYIVDIGPGPGEHGGEVVFAGTPEEIMTDEKSITGKYLSGREYIAVPAKRRETGENWLQIRGARANNLKNVNVDIPLGVFTCVTGVSGSGKSSLVNEVLKKTLLRDLNRARTRPGEHDEILGIDKLDKIIDIDQSPIGRTPRSNPATYTGLFDLIRDVFAQTPDAKMRGYTNGRFSFNVKGGRCEACRGDGILKIEMHFLPDIYVPCEVCGGKRYNRETLEVKYKGKTIADVLDMTVEEAMKFFAPLPKLARKLQTLYDVGLGYIRLGQSSTTLSGGEAQRVKLATELARRDTGRTLYVLDEPTTGLHTDDVKRLIAILQRLCDGGSTVVVIEHNLDVIKTADYIIDLGPEGGDMGGTIVCTGTPEQVAQNKKSYTGIYLKPMLEKGIRE
mgnify:CR=1 FL=1